MTRLLTFFILLTLAGVRVGAAVWTVPDLNYNTVNNRALTAADGDTIMLPAGSATWPASVNPGRNLAFIGISSNSVGGTIITPTGPSAFEIQPSIQGFPRVSGIRFVNNTDGTISVIMKNSNAARVDHCFFANNADHTKSIYASGFNGPCYGVIDHNTFQNGVVGVLITGSSDAWSQPITFGGTNAMVLEDNTFVVDTDTFTYDHRVYHEQGGRGVTRYNTFLTSAGLDDHGWLDAHGNQTYAEWGGNALLYGATVTTEQYYNTVNFSKTPRFAHIRGGAHIIFGNTLICPAGGRETWELDEEEYWQTSFFGPAGPPWGPTSSPATSHLRNTWPAQMAVTNTFFGTNTLNGVRVTSVPLGTPAVLLQENRDFWFTMPNATNGSPAGRYNGYVPLVYPHPLVGGVTPPTTAGAVSFSASSYSFPEPIGSPNTGTFTVTQSANTSNVVTLVVTTLDGTALTGHDYTTNRWTFTWPVGVQGAMSAAFTLLASGDTAPTNRVLNLQVVSIIGGSVSGPTTVPVTIVMNRPPVTFLFNITSVNPNSSVTIDVSPADANGSTSGNTAFTRTYPTNTSVMLAAPATAGGNAFTKWQRDGVDLSASANVVVNANAAHTFTAIYATPPPPTVIQLSVSSVPSGAVITVSPADNNSQGNGTASFSRLYNAGTLVSLTAPSSGFQKWQRDGVDFTVNPATSFTMGSAHALTAFYAITNGGQFGLSASSYQTGVTNGSVTITVNRSGSSSTGASVHYATQNGSAVSGTDYTATSGNLTFVGNGSQTFSVPIINTGAVGPARFFSIVLSSPSNGATLGSISQALVSIQQNGAVIGNTTITIGGKVMISGPVQFKFQ